MIKRILIACCLVLVSTLFARQSAKPNQPPSSWRGLIGEYTNGRETVYVREDGGRLELASKQRAFIPLASIDDTAFAFLLSPLGVDELLRFTRRASGVGAAFSFGEKQFHRVNLDGEFGETFKIKTLKGIDELRALAFAATPPLEKTNFLKPDLVELARLDSTIRLDIRYASANNFMGEKFYSQPRAFMQRPAADGLLKAHRWLNKRGYGLLIHDAYRPWYVTKMFWEATPESQRIFVADPAKGSRHNRGCAVDLTLYEIATGQPVEMVSGYDEFSERAYPHYAGGTSQQRWHRELLRTAMEANGFAVYEWEWWHFDFRGWEQYPIGTMKFEELQPRPLLR